MRLVVISDTHGRHRDLGTLEGDVPVHCGDFGDGLVRDLDAWLAEQRVDVVLCVGGNHDFDAEERARAGEPVFGHAVWRLDDG